MPSDVTHVAIYLDAAPGPIARMTSVARHLAARVTLLSTGPIPAVDGCRPHHLPSARNGMPPVVDPTGYPTVGADTVADLAAWIRQESPNLLVVDGAPDIALIGRLAGVPVVPVRRFGIPPGPGKHALEQVAAAWLAPYPAVLEPGTTSEAVRARTLHAGLISRFEGRRLRPAAARRQLGLDPDARHLTIVTGADGLGVTGADIAAVAEVAPSWSISVIGRCGGITATPLPERVRIEGWLTDPLPHVVAADVVVAGASLSTVSDVAVARRPLALLPRPGPVDEEERLAQAIAELRAATVFDTWPRPAEWPELLERLLAFDGGGLRKLSDGRGAVRAASWIDAWAVTPPLDPAAELARALRAPKGRCPAAGDPGEVDLRDPRPFDAATGA